MCNYESDASAGFDFVYETDEKFSTKLQEFS